jgi:ribosomal protein L29
VPAALPHNVRVLFSLQKVQMISFEKVTDGRPFLMVKPQKPHELRNKSRQELLETLATLEKKLFETRSQLASSSGRAKLSELQTVRRDVARVKTILMEQQRKALQDRFKDQRFVPIDIRPNVVKSQRKKLPAKFANKLTVRARRRAKFLKPVKFALKA